MHDINCYVNITLLKVISIVNYSYIIAVLRVQSLIIYTWILILYSAGVGRTGTFIALDIGLQQANKERQVDFVSIINKMREQRMKMIQTKVSSNNKKLFASLSLIFYI